MKLLAISCAVLTVATLPSVAFQSSNSLYVKKINSTTFEVPYRGKSGAPSFWCAAGDFVVRGLGMSYNTIIWRVSEPPRQSGEGITFSLSSENAATGTGLVILGKDSGALSAARATELCSLEMDMPLD